MKPYRLFTIILLALFTLTFGKTFITRSITYEEPTLAYEAIHAELQKVVPDAKTFRHAGIKPSIYEALDSKQNIIGYAFCTQHIVNEISGYGGPIEMAVGIDKKGAILGIHILKHRETPCFAEKFPEFINRFIGKNIRTPFKLGENIDGITGATVTSSAIIAAINESAQKISPHLKWNINQSSLLHEDRQKIFPALAIILILFTMAGLTCVSRKKLIRWAALTSGFVLLGLIFREMLSTSHIAGIALFQNPGWRQNPLLHLLILGALAGSLFLGRVYCSGVCPFAFIEESLHWISRKFFKLNFSPDEKTDYICRWIKYLFLTIIVATCFLLEKTGIGAVEVYLTLFFGTGSLAAWVLLITVLFASFFFLRFWCRYLCPCGAFLALIAQLKLCNKSQTIPQKDYSMCADPAECFYCDQCACSDFSKSTTRQNTFFIILIVFSFIAFAFSFTQTIISLKTQNRQPEKIVAPAATQAYSESERIKKKLHEAGLTPRDAKYWKVLNDE